MYYILASSKTVAEAARDLTAAAQAHGFGVLHVHDLAATLARKGHPIGAQCQVFEVCNPQHAARVLARDMRVNMALPCRISVFEENGVTKIGTILPTATLSMLSPDRELAEVAAAVERTVKAIIDDAAEPLDARQALTRRRAALALEVEAGVDKRRGEPRSNVPDSAELAADDVVREVGIAEVDRDLAEIAAIDAAIERLDNGTYGRCLDCHSPIDSARLAHNPEVARCVPCQARAERKAPPRIARL
jgi:uncharacterized protein (DUF302 family)/RNA polymerase-binding transcription factor DksA